MRVKHLLWTLVGALALSACSSEDDVLNGGGNSDVKGESRYMAVQISSPTTSLTRADETYAPHYEKGADAENGISSLRFYFFDNSGNAVTVNNGVNYVTPLSIEPDGDEPANIEKKYKAVVVINTEKGDDANVNTMLAVANYECADLGSTSLSLNALKDKVSTYTSAAASKAYEETGEGETKTKSGGFLMTSSSYVGADGPVTVATIEPKNLCTSEDDALKEPVAIYIERVVAKVRLDAAWITTGTSPMSLMSDVKIGDQGDVETNNNPFKGKTFTAVALKDNTDAHKPIKVGDKQVYAIFTGWNVTGTADKSYLIKKVGNWNLGAWNEWNDAAKYRSYWAENPAGVTLGHIAYNGANLAIGTTAAAYCFENAADASNNGIKSGYTASTEVSNRTQVLIAAILVTIDETTKIAEPLSLAKWAGRDYTEADVTAKMYGQVTSQIFYETTEGEPSETNPRKFASIPQSYVVLATGQDADEAVDTNEDSKRYLSYLQLTPAIAEQVKTGTLKLYTAAVKEAKTDEEIAAAEYKADAVKDLDVVGVVNKVLSNVPGAKVWSSGLTYYYTDLKHLGTEETKGLYGVVRNHIYDVKLNTVYGLGTPVLKPEEVIIPQHTDDDDTYIAAQVNVLSWRVVPNNVDLAW